jgi:selenocysteine-specific elongation factor
MKHVTIGVAGHVDHGKTSLVRLLTGIDTDRHPEEKRRGLSLEAGIAEWPRPDGSMVAFVDVPGHSDFMKNTIRGLQGVDIAVLVVAADDGVMPQTREHLEILSFLQVRHGLVVLSKIDCVDAETLELAELEVAELVSNSFLEGKPVLHFSAVNRNGINSIIQALDRAVQECPGRNKTGPFRLWIDHIRSFVGFGTVVSGTVLSGAIRTGEEISIQPGDLNTRIRSLERHGRKIDEAFAGQRIGINLHRVGLDELTRGMSLASPGRYSPVFRFNAVLRKSVFQTGNAIKEGQKIRLYLGVSVHVATVRFVGPDLFDSHGKRFVQLQFKKPVVAAPGDCIVLSTLDMNSVIAGGSVLELGREKVRQANNAPLANRLRAIDSNDLADYLEQMWVIRPGVPVDPECLAVETPFKKDRIIQFIAGELEYGKLIVLPNGVVRRMDFDLFSRQFVDMVSDEFQRKPDREPMRLTEITHQFRPGCDEHLAFLIADELCQKGKFVKERGGVRPAGFQQSLPEDLSGVADLLRNYGKKQGVRPFGAGYFVQSTNGSLTLRQVERTLDFFCKTGEMIRLKNDRYITSSALSEIKRKVGAWVEKNGEFCLRDCKEALDFNRGLGLPVLEYLDNIGFTMKKGEGRVVKN